MGVRSERCFESVFAPFFLSPVPRVGPAQPVFFWRSQAFYEGLAIDLKLHEEYVGA